MNDRLAISRSELEQFCRENGIRRLSLFGSTLEGAARPDSDIDLLVEFEPERVPGLLGLAEIEAQLSQMLDGRPVDLRTPNDLSELFRDEIIEAAEVQYAA